LRCDLFENQVWLRLWRRIVYIEVAYHRKLFFDVLTFFLVYAIITPHKKNNTDRSTFVGNRACRATAPLGDKETRCKSVATAIAVIRRFCLSVGMLIGLCLTKNSWATGERDRAEWIRQGIPFRHGGAPLGGCFCFILIVSKTRKEVLRK
jgi:hypothetical protein